MTGRDWMEQALTAKALARRLWIMLTLPEQDRLLDVLSVEARAFVDPPFDAAQIVFERERIFVEPCRRVFDDQCERYCATFPGAEVRILTRDQLLMLAGPNVGEDTPDAPHAAYYRRARSLWDRP